MKSFLPSVKTWNCIFLTLRVKINVNLRLWFSVSSPPNSNGSNPNKGALTPLSSSKPILCPLSLNNRMTAVKLQRVRVAIWRISTAIKPSGEWINVVNGNTIRPEVFVVLLPVNRRGCVAPGNHHRGDGSTPQMTNDAFRKFWSWEDTNTANY